jgi:hypothetical protein
VLLVVVVAGVVVQGKGIVGRILPEGAAEGVGRMLAESRQQGISNSSSSSL